MNFNNKQLKSIPIRYFISDNNEKILLIFLHPAFADHRTFDKQINYFYDNYRIVTMDLIGHGLSQGFKTNEGIDVSANHIKEIMDIEGYKTAHIVGVSIGALIAEDFANKYPDYVLSLCAVGGYDINNYDKSIEKEQRTQQLSFMFKAIVSIKWFSKSNALVSAKSDEAQKDFYKMNMLFKRSSLKYMATLGNIMNKFTHEKITYPLLILCGEYDSKLALTLAKKWHDSEPTSKFSIIKNAGHCANMDNAKDFNNTLKRFLLQGVV